MSRALESRLRRIERSIGKVSSSPAAIEAWINHAMDDPAFLVEEIRLHPGRPGSHLASVNAELLELVPFLAAGGMMPNSCRGLR